MVGEIFAWAEHGHTLYEFDTDMSSFGIYAALEEEGIDPDRLDIGYNGHNGACIQGRNRTAIERAHRALRKHD